MDNNLLDDWFTKSQAAAVLQVSEKTVERMAHKGEIRRETRKRPGLRPLPVYSPEDLDRVKAAQVPQMAVLPPQAEAGGVPALAPRVDLPSFNRSYLVRTCRCLTSLKSVSSMKLHRDIGVSQPTAWFMLRRIREAWANEPGGFSGSVKVDESYFGGRRRNISMIQAQGPGGYWTWSSRQNGCGRYQGPQQ